MGIRMDALSAVALHSGSLNDDLLDRLIGLYQESGSPTASARAAQIIGAAKLTPKQLMRVAPLLTQLHPRNCENCCEFFSDR